MARRAVAHCRHRHWGRSAIDAALPSLSVLPVGIAAAANEAFASRPLQSGDVEAVQQLHEPRHHPPFPSAALSVAT